jgi:hydrogenase maturation protease
VRNSEHKTLVLGLGNTLMGDEGVGVHVLRELEKRSLPAGVECLDGGTGGFVLLEPLQTADRIVMIDAAADGNPIGTITRTTPRFSSDYPPTMTAHDVGVKDLLDIFYTLGGDCEVVLFAITIDPYQTITLSMSAVVEQAAHQAVGMIVDELNGFAEAGRADLAAEVCCVR